MDAGIRGAAGSSPRRRQRAAAERPGALPGTEREVRCRALVRGYLLPHENGFPAGSFDGVDANNTEASMSRYRQVKEELAIPDTAHATTVAARTSVNPAALGPRTSVTGHGPAHTLRSRSRPTRDPGPPTAPPGQRPAGAAPRAGPDSVPSRKLRRDNPAPGYEHHRLLQLPGPRRHRILPVLGRDPAVERESQAPLAARLSPATG